MAYTLVESSTTEGVCELCDEFVPTGERILKHRASNRMRHSSCATTRIKPFGETKRQFISRSSLSRNRRRRKSRGKHK